MKNHKLLHIPNISRLANLLSLLVLAGSLVLLFASCTDSSTDPDSSEFNIQTNSTQSQGEVIADGDGNTLYYFTPDAEGTSVCEDECINAWPVFHADSIRPGDDLEPANFGTVSRPDGGNQTTHLGWPLYYFSGDNQPGDVNGEAVVSFGGAWYVAKPNYTIMQATQQLVGHDDLNYIVDENGNYVEGEGMTSHFTDENGNTLYAFLDDSANTNNFTAEDFSNNNIWPIYEESSVTVPSTLNSTHFGSIDVFGRTQLTYKGWPLYYFGQDAERGETKGISFPDQAEPGLWPVAQRDMPAAPGYSSNDTGDGTDDPDY